jgi:hypothetical protein
MSKKSFSWKLAVAALAVAGVVGLVWAALPTAGSGKLDKMKVSFEIVKLMEIECTAKPVDAATLKATDVSLVANAGADAGTLGTIRVKTNSTGWDVWMTTDFGGRLVYVDGGSLVPGTCPPAQVDPWNPSNCLVTVPPVLQGASQTPLIYNSTTGADAPGVIGTTLVGTNSTNDEVQLQVSIGLASRGDQLSTSATADMIYGIGAPTAYVVPRVINNVLLETTGTVLGSLAATTPAYVSFATELGTHYGTTPPGAPVMTGIGGLPANPNFRTWANIALNGFPTPNNAIASTPAEHVDEQYFFVNVGLVNGLIGNISGNDEGVYEETFTFELAASF